MLRQLFEPYGKIKSIDLSTYVRFQHASGILTCSRLCRAKDKNFAFVIFESSVAVKTVMAEPKIMLNGKQLSVQEVSIIADLLHHAWVLTNEIRALQRTAPGNSGRSYGRTERRTYRARNSRSNENSG